MLNAMTDEEYMQLALQEAQAAAVIGEIPIGAVLVVEGEVVARAHNMRETWNDATAHAEVIVIREACKKLGRWRLEGAVLYVTAQVVSGVCEAECAQVMKDFFRRRRAENRLAKAGIAADSAEN